ncbi:unnamed protein product [Trichogramma brassicae]|uniref:Reverse transcriptase zinc-binding domain-containing protein n=1 Tax=Trichogramma brassicae TaxID=86971 RepID=A0A6H5IRM8_9HYME|nr:unnamed protein product [Trichogramma brassicae]
MASLNTIADATTTIKALNARSALIHRECGARVLSLPEVQRRKRETTLPALRGHDAGKHHQAHARDHSQRYDNTLSALCPACPSTIEDAEHVFFRCPRFHEDRERLQQVLQEEIEPENIIRHMLKTAGNWLAVASFAQSVVTRLRQEAQEV